MGIVSDLKDDAVLEMVLSNMNILNAAELYA